MNVSTRVAIKKAYAEPQATLVNILAAAASGLIEPLPRATVGSLVNRISSLTAGQATSTELETIAQERGLTVEAIYSSVEAQFLREYFDIGKAQGVIEPDEEFNAEQLTFLLALGIIDSDDVELAPLNGEYVSPQLAGLTEEEQALWKDVDARAQATYEVLKKSQAGDAGGDPIDQFLTELEQRSAAQREAQNA